MSCRSTEKGELELAYGNVCVQGEITSHPNHPRQRSTAQQQQQEQEQQ